MFMASITISQIEIKAHSCSNTGNYTTNSIYRQNLDTLLSSIASNTQIDYGFYNFSAGQQPDRVNAIALCLADLTVEKCRSCLLNSTRRILQECPNQKEAVGWYTVCMIRYSNTSIFGIRNDKVLDPVFIWGRKASDIGGYNLALSRLLQTLRNRAAAGDSRHKFAVGEIAATNLDTIFGFLQCTPDLSSVDCNNCLMKAAQRVPNGSMGTRIFSTSCFLRYETNDLFYNTLPPPPPPPPAGSAPSPPMSPPPPPTPGNSSRTIVIVVVSIVSAIVLVVVIFIIVRLRRRKIKRTADKLEGEWFMNPLFS
ncbi:Cysteine-rich receptor-like protein kinase 26, partial [Cucurbita argyrosperma subsp. sororia]